MMNERPMVWLYSEPDLLANAKDIMPPPPLQARRGNAPARGGGVLASGGYALARDTNVVDWLQQNTGSRQYPIGTADVRTRDAQRDPNLMDTTADRDIVPWQFCDIPPRLVPGLLTYAEVIKKWSNVSEFAILYSSASI